MSHQIQPDPPCADDNQPPVDDFPEGSVTCPDCNGWGHFKRAAGERYPGQCDRCNADGYLWPDPVFGLIANHP